jgi:hypothetical protein
MKSTTLFILLGATIAAGACSSESPKGPEKPPEDPLAAVTKQGPEIEKAGTGFEKTLEAAPKLAEPQPLPNLSGRQPVESALPTKLKIEQLISPLSPKQPLKTTSTGKTLTHESPFGVELEWSWRTVANTELFGEGGVCPNDINQGALADVYLLAAMAALSLQDPSLLSEMIEVGSDNTYTVTFNQVVASEIGGFAPDGRRVPIRVDGNLPFLEGKDNALLGAQLTDSDEDGQVEIGVALIEKAYASYLEKQQLAEGGKTGYSGIEGGFCDVALTVLSGENYAWSEVAKLTDERLTDTLGKTNAGMPVVAVSATDTEGACEGIVSGHAYTVLGTFADPGTGEQYVILRNPWGNHEPGSDGADDGIFKVPFGTFKKCMHEIDYPADTSGYPTEKQSATASTSPLSALSNRCR